MRFQLIDAVLEQSPERILAVKQVTLAEEYLGDHFPGFPVLPGVLMIEAMAQAARIMLAPRNPDDPRLVLGEVRALKFGNMVRPGQRLEIEVELLKAGDDGSFACKGTGRVRGPAGDSGRSGEDSSREIAVSGRFIMRPLRPA